MATVKNYKSVYANNIAPIIGSKLLSEVTSVDCQLILNNMADKGKKSSSIKNARAILKSILDYAFQNDIISKNPCNKYVTYKIGKNSEPRKALTIEEQKTLCRAISGCRCEYIYRFALQTGLRVSELNGLKWSDIDWDKKNIHVQRSLVYDSKIKGWTTESLKTQNSFRTIPLTKEAINVLHLQEQKNKSNKLVKLELKDFIFLGKKGSPLNTSNLDAVLKTICYESGLRKISMHILRHTFATRCIEAGMKPKTLQTILGHSTIAVTMNFYVDTTEEQSEKEIRLVENSLLVG